MNRRYASQTDVPVERSKAEIERVLHRYGASQFVSGWHESRAMVAFCLNGRIVRFTLTLPDKASQEFGLTETGRERSDAQSSRLWEQACRQRWRALLLCIKAKLESVDSGIESFEEAFLPHFVLPGGVTMGEKLIPSLPTIMEKGEMPRLLMGI